MYKKLLFAVAMIIAVAANQACAQFKMETGVANYGVRFGGGFPNMDKFKLGKLTPTTPAIGAFFDLGIFGESGLSFGGEFNYAKFKNVNDNRLGVMSIIVFLKYYTPLTFNKVATYVRGDFLPTNVIAASDATGGEHKLKSIFGIYAGADYRLTDTFGAFVELGTGYTIFNTGVSFRVER